jgi:hypothetical protein
MEAMSLFLAGAPLACCKRGAHRAILGITLLWGQAAEGFHGFSGLLVFLVATWRWRSGPRWSARPGEAAGGAERRAAGAVAALLRR